MKKIMKFPKFFYLIWGVLFLGFWVYSYYQWWLDTPWRERWKKLTESPELFYLKEIELKGKVINPYTILGTTISVYALEFESYRYDVISYTGIPEDKAGVIVKGKVKKGFKVETFFGNRKIIKTFPWVIIEEERREIP